MEPFVLRAARAVPRLGIRAGDYVVVQDGTPNLNRPIPNAGAVLLAYEDGALELISSPPDPLSLRQAVGLASPAPSGRRYRLRRAGPDLRVVR